MADLDGKGVRRTCDDGGAPSWQDYIDALRIEGRRYRPASLRDAPEKTDQQSPGKAINGQTGCSAQPASDEIAETGRAATVCRRGTEATVRTRK